MDLQFPQDEVYDWVYEMNDSVATALEACGVNGIRAAAQSAACHMEKSTLGTTGLGNTSVVASAYPS